MKRLFSLVLAVTLTVLLCSCGKTGFKTRNVTSDIYSEEDITGAKNAVVSRLSSEKGITLLELYYAGDEKTEKIFCCARRGRCHCFDIVI